MCLLGNVELCLRVALLAEGVDRNASMTPSAAMSMVALLAEGVDRNKKRLVLMGCQRVALLAEGVDRNSTTA